MTIRVLLADDHAMLRQGLKALLERAPDIEVVGEAADGREALARAEELAPDVVVMDISMRELNGIEAARSLREACPTTRVVMLSMHSSSEYVFRAFEAGAVGYVLKDSAGQEVAAAVRAVMQGRRYLSPSIAEFENLLGSRSGRKSPLDRLSAREREVLQLVVEGRSSTEIAKLVHLSPKTVETYRARLMAKLGVRDAAALIKFAIEHGLTPPA